jgi:hypothetical protein
MKPFAFPVVVVCVVILAAASSGTSEEPPTPVKAPDLTREFAKDEKAAKAKYLDKNMITGKTLIVEGKVVAVEAKPDKAAKITLAGHNETDKEPIRVDCYFPVDLAEEVKKVEKGATVKVKGEFGPGSSLLLKVVDLQKCGLVK